MNPIKVGIIGTGMIAEVHAKAIRDAQGTTLVAVCGRSEEKARALAERFDAEAMTDQAALLGRADIDAVTIATPSGAHLDAAVPAAEAGKHILCEKPLEVTLARVDQIIESCRQHGVTLACVFQARLNRNVTKIKEAIDAGRLGRLVFASVQMPWFRDQAYYDSGGWRGTWGLDGGGVLMNQGIHSLDLLCHLAGRPEVIQASAATLSHERIEVEDTAAALLRLPGGGLGTLQATTCAAPGFGRRLELTGEKGSVALEDDRLVRWAFAEPHEDDEQILAEGSGGDNLRSGASSPGISHDGHRRLVEDWVQAISEQRPPAIPGQEARHAIKLIEDIYVSAGIGPAPSA